MKMKKKIKIFDLSEKFLDDKNLKEFLVSLIPNLESEEIYELEKLRRVI
jgi:hypothetical protein